MNAFQFVACANVRDLPGDYQKLVQQLRHSTSTYYYPLLSIVIAFNRTILVSGDGSVSISAPALSPLVLLWLSLLLALIFSSSPSSLGSTSPASLYVVLSVTPGGSERHLECADYWKSHCY
jgi:hypothetical protein